MNKVLKFPNEQLLCEQAAAWIARFDRKLSAGEQLELQHWLNEDAGHRTALFEMAELWDRTDVLGEISELFPLESPASKWTSLYVRPIALSLLLLVAVSVGFWVSVKGPATLATFTADKILGHRHIEATYQTAIGEQRSVTLPDKSIVTLNTATLLRVHYTDSDRKIELVRGEAHFEVAKHEGRLFTVTVGENEFRAVGTAFNVRVQSERGIELTVTEGRVQVVVSANKEAHRVAAVAEPIATEIMVDAGKEVAIDQAIQTVERLEPEKIQAALAWQHGMIVFDNEPLEQAIREVSRYSSVQFVIAEEQTRQTPVAGYFKIGDIDGLIAALQTNFDIDASKNGNSIILSTHH